MSYTTTGIAYLGAAYTDLGMVVRARTTHADKVIQAYVSGELLCWAWPQDGTVQFALGESLDTEMVFLLAVDPQEAQTNFWNDAFPAAAQHGNRIQVQTPQTIAPYGPGDVWKVYRGGAGEESATVLVHRQEFYPLGLRACGFGAEFGDGGLGWDAAATIGMGYNFGYGEMGFDCEMLRWTSEPLPPGVYPIKVTVEDACGNESAAYETTVTLTTYPRPPRSLAVDSYTRATDTLRLSFTPSEDL